MVLGDVIDQFHDDHGLADARAAEQSNLAALQERLNQIDDLHSGFEHFGGCRLLVERRRQTMNRHSLFELDRTELIHGFADHIHYAAQSSAAHGNGNRPALVNGFHAAHHAVGGRHGDAAYSPFAEMLLHLENHVDGSGHGEAIAHHPHRLINRRQFAFGELDVYRWPRDLNYLSYIFSHMFSGLSN